MPIAGAPRHFLLSFGLDRASRRLVFAVWTGASNNDVQLAILEWSGNVVADAAMALPEEPTHA
jgi:hypothetical protein